jgi:hypothetical protein
MMKRITAWLLFLTLALPASSWAWHDQTHLAIAIAAGYEQWYNAAGADMAKIKAGVVEQYNHYANNPFEAVVTPDMVLHQVDRYNDPNDEKGHLYGAILASIREFRTTAQKEKYDKYHLAFCAHYVGDLSMPLHNTLYNDYNKRNHTATDGIIEDDVINHLSMIKVYPIVIESEADLAKEIARIANIAKNLGYRLEKEGRMLSKAEAYQQVSHSASLLSGILMWLKPETKD